MAAKNGRLLSLLLILLSLGGIKSSFATTDPASQQPSMRNLVAMKERMVYSVHYGFLTLGHVTIETVRDTLYKGKPAFYFRTIIKSNPSIPFVGNKERHFHSIFSYNDTTAYGLDFWTDSIHDNEFEDSRYTFYYDRGYVIAQEINLPTDTLALSGPADSGPLLFYITRLHAGLTRTVEYPIYITGERGNVVMDYTSRVDRLDIPAFGGMTEAYYSSGNAAVKGPFGFSGFYRAWHRTDRSRIPLEAHVKVWVGNVKVRLISYERIR